MSEITIDLGASIVQDPTLWRRNADAPAFAQSRPLGAPREIKDEAGYVARLMWMSLHREVALKLVSDELSTTSKGRERFHREARAIAALRHPNIVEIYDYSGVDSDHLYLVL